METTLPDRGLNRRINEQIEFTAVTISWMFPIEGYNIEATHIDDTPEWRRLAEDECGSLKRNQSICSRLLSLSYLVGEHSWTHFQPAPPSYANASLKIFASLWLKMNYIMITLKESDRNDGWWSHVPHLRQRFYSCAHTPSTDQVSTDTSWCVCTSGSKERTWSYSIISIIITKAICNLQLRYNSNVAVFTLM